MKKALIVFIMSIVIITVSLTIMPVVINADVETIENSIDFFVPDSGITKEWTNPEDNAIRKVTVEIYSISDPTDKWTESFTKDGYQFPATVSGIGTSNITIEIISGSSDNYRAKVTFYSDVWIRDREMTCLQVWINEDNKFQFSFIYPYRDNNWVKIYDMTGNMVYEIDMPYDNPNIIVDLPDGMYTVKTFTAGSIEPIQTFVIGK